MKQSIIVSFLIMIVISALYRIMPNRPMGFAPQIAMGLFSGALFIKDKKWAFAIPLMSMLVSDCLFQVLYQNGLTTIWGFYEGQWLNYLLFAGITCFGFFIKSTKITTLIITVLAAPTTYFLLSNFYVWITNSGLGLNRSMNMKGLLLTYWDALPFYYNSLAATITFSALLFGTYFLWQNKIAQKQMA